MTPEAVHARDQSQNAYLKRFGVVSLGVLFGLALIIYLTWSDHQDVLKATGDNVRDYAAILETRLDSTLRRADAELLELVADIPVVALNKQEVSRYATVLNAKLDSGMVKFLELAGFRVLDATGDQLYSSDRANTPRANVFDRDYFRRLSNDPSAELVFSEVNISRTTGRPTLVAGRAIKDGQGVFRGIVIASIELEFFQKLFQSLQLDSGSVVAIYRRDDFSLVVRWPRGDSQYNNKLPSDNPARALFASGKTIATATFASATDSIVRIYGFRALASFPFFVGVGISRDEALDEWRSGALGVGLSVLVFLGLLTALLIQLSRSEVRRAHSTAVLAQSEARSRQLFERASEGILIASPNGDLISLNYSFARMHGYSIDEMLGMSLKNLDAPADAQLIPERAERILSGESVTFEVEHYHRDGHVFPLEVSASMILSGGERLIQAFYRDIAERRQTALELGKFKNVVDSSDDAIITMALDGTILSWNYGAEVIFGYTAVEIVGHSMRMLCPEDRMHEEREILDRIAGGERIAHFETIRRHKDGRTVPISATFPPVLDNAGNMVSISSVARDITERMQAQESAMAFQEQLRALSTGLSNIRESEATALSRELHDSLGQDLAALKMDMVWIAPKLREDQQAINSRVEDAVILVDSLMSQVGEIAMRLRPPVLDDAGIIGAIEWQAADFEKRFEIVCKVESKEIARRLTQEQDIALYRIVQEALTNVARHSAATHVEISIFGEVDCLTLMIMDNGRGIGSEALAHSKSIGLLGMKERALAIGATLTIDSAPGKGATITVKVPLPVQGIGPGQPTDSSTLSALLLRGATKPEAEC